MKKLFQNIMIRMPVIFIILSIYIFQSDGINDNYYGDSKEQNTGGYAEEIKKKKIALTFDDGPIPETTPILLKSLKQKGVVATFFVQGKQASRNPEIIKEMYQDGHEIGNHTYNHVDLLKLSNKQIEEECNRTDDIIKYITGEKPKVFRPTFGSYDKRVENAIEDKYFVLWSIDIRDWRRTDVNRMLQDVIKKVDNGDIILLHDVYLTSVDLAIKIVDSLLAEGYEFVTVSQMIQESTQNITMNQIIKSIGD